MSCFHSSLTKTTKFWTNHILKLTQKPYSYLCVLPIAFIFQYFHYRGSIRYAGGMMKGGALPCRVQWLSRNIPDSVQVVLSQPFSQVQCLLGWRGLAALPNKL